MATGVASWSQTAATNASADSAVNFAEGQAPSTVNDSARGLMASGAKYRDDTAGSLTTGGTSTAYTLTTNQSFASLTALDGMELAVKFNATNGAAPTLAVDGLTAKAINVSHATAVGTGVILANSVWGLTYNNSNNCFLLRAVPGTVQDGTVATASLAAAAVTYAKIQNVAASSLIGNATGSSAVPTAISLGAGLAFVGSALTPTISAPLIPNYISGLNLSYTNTTTFGIAAGVASDSTNVSLMSLGSAYTKTTSAWSLGSGGGGLDTGAIGAASWYHVYLIQRPDTGVVDVLYSLNATTPTQLPTNYTLYRRIGSILTSSSQWVQFSQVGDEFLWNVGVSDVSVTNPGTSAVTRTLTVPTGIKVWANINVAVSDSAGGASGYLFTSFDEADTAPTNTTIFTFQGTGTSNGGASGQLIIRTNTSAQIRSRCSASAAGTVMRIYTRGWTDLRGKL